MTVGRNYYRIRQFWDTLHAKTKPEDLKLVRDLLTPAQRELFTRMQANEQVHSISVMKRLRCDMEGDSAEQSQDLLVAALLHDVGKSRYPLRLWERVIIVLSKALFPGMVMKWGAGQPNGWQRAFVIAEQHPEWGAQMAAEAGTTACAIELIRQHQNFYPDNTVSIEGRLLIRLQGADRNS